jgi:Leucine-rich repeat (LRR) protein
LSAVAEPEPLPLVQGEQDSPVEALPELSGGRSGSLAELNPLEISAPQIEDLEPLRVSIQEPEALPGVSLPDPPQLQDLPPLQLDTPRLQDLQLLSLPQHDFQEIDVESLLASVQQRDERSFFQLTGNIPLLSEM